MKTILRLPAVTAQIGLSRSTLYTRVSQGLWPKPVSLGARAVGWPSDEVAAVISAHVAGESDEYIRGLVAEIQASRNTVAT